MLEYERETTPVIVAGDQFELIDSDGRRYLDGVSSLWCNIHGHRVPEIDAALHAQIDRISHSTLLGLANESSAELAHELVQAAPPGLNRVFFSDDGSTAVEAALKLVFQYHRQKPDPEPQRDLFVGLSGAYHGDTLGAVSVGSIGLFHQAYERLLFRSLAVTPPLDPVAMQSWPGIGSEQAERALAQLEQTLRQQADRIAGFVIEPLVQMAGGILIHQPGFLRRVRELTRELSIPLIADEVAVAFGRTGTLWACEQEAVQPDLLCLSKGLTGGYLPLAATLVTEPIYAAFLDEPARGKTFYHGHTFTGNPLGCVAALASLRRFETHRTLENVRLISSRLSERLAAYIDHPQVRSLRQKGLLAGIELCPDRSLPDGFAPDRRIGHRVVLAARRRGVFLRPLGDLVELIPAPAMPVALVDRLCDVVFESIDEVLAAESGR